MKNLMNYESIEKILGSEDPFNIEPSISRELRFKSLKASFEHHYLNNKVYKGFCELANVSPADIKNYEDLVLIPLVPSDFFRDVSATGRHEDLVHISSVPDEQIARYFTTSGTGGQPSIYPYDGRSLGTINRSNVIIFKKICDLKPDDYMLFLTPSPDKADTGMVQGMYLTMKGILKDIDSQLDFAVQNKVLDPKSIVNKLTKVKDRTRHLYGPPYAYNQLCDQMSNLGLKMGLDPDSKAITSGGWKSFKDEAINPSELRKKIQEAFGIAPQEIRDGLGLTDIMSILLECQYGNKHVPPWMEVSIRDLNDPSWKTEVAPGKDGLIAFLDPLIASFPAYIVTGDVGKLIISQDEKCSCGRYGATIEYVRRAGDPRGCALRQEQLMSEVESKRKTK